MSDTGILTHTYPVDTGFDDHIRHIPCCKDDRIALCGISLEGYITKIGDKLICIVCEGLLEKQHCPKFGQCADTAFSVSEN